MIADPVTKEPYGAYSCTTLIILLSSPYCYKIYKKHSQEENVSLCKKTSPGTVQNSASCACIPTMGNKPKSLIFFLWQDQQ